MVPVAGIVVVMVTLCCGLRDRIYGENPTPAENAIIAMRTVVIGNRAFLDDNMLHDHRKV